MSNALAELPQPAETFAGLCQRVAALEARLPARKRPINVIGRRCLPRMTRSDRTPYGWMVARHDPAKMVPDPVEQCTIWILIEAAQNPAMGPRALCRWLDSQGRKRRGGKKWAAGGHTTVMAILKRHDAATPDAAVARIRERIAAKQAKAADRLYL